MTFCRLFKKYFLFILLSLLIPGASSLSALPSINDFLSFDEYMTIINEGEVTLFHFEDTTPQLMPSIPQAEELKDLLKGKSPNFAIEGLFFIQTLNRESNREEDLTNIVNILSSVSSLQGLEYFSASRNEMRLLFEECWRIDNAEDRTPLADLSFTELPGQVEYTIHQKDLTFGANLSHVEISSSPESLLMTMTNLTNMKYDGWLKVIDRGNFQTGVLVIPVEEGILYYGVMSAKTLGLGFIVNKASNSFYNRMKALFIWFNEMYQ
jgi:hypothetical protein